MKIAQRKAIYELLNKHAKLNGYKDYSDCYHLGNPYWINYVWCEAIDEMKVSEPLQPAKSLQEIKSPESFLDDAIWRRWGQRLFDLANGMSGESFIALAKPQVIEAMELYASQFKTPPVQEDHNKKQNL